MKKLKLIKCYPKFDSYNKKLVLSELIENVDFIGGYSLHGNRFLASGGHGEAVKLVLQERNKFIEAASNRISNTNKRVTASEASIKIIFPNDSIMHPGLNLHFDQDEEILNLIRDGKGLSLAPYLNSYHDLEMDFQVLKWNLNEDEISFCSMPERQ